MGVVTVKMKMIVLYFYCFNCNWNIFYFIFLLLFNFSLHLADCDNNILLNLERIRKPKQSDFFLFSKLKKIKQEHFANSN